MTASIRRRLNLGALLAVTVTLSIAGVGVDALIRSRLIAEIDGSLFAALSAQAGPLTLRMTRGPREPARFLGGRSVSTSEGGAALGFAFQAWGQEGTERTESLTADLPRLGADLELLTLDQLAREEVLFAWVERPDGSRARAAAARFDPPPHRFRGRDQHRGPRPFGRNARPPHFGATDNEPPPDPAPVEVVLVREVDDVFATIALVRSVLVGAWIATGLACSLALFFVTRRSLSPLVSLRAQLKNVDVGDLGTRIALNDAPEELLPVVDQLNQLLASLDRAFEHERAFTSDAAHELRTPLAGLRAQLEFALARTRSPEDYERTAKQCLDVTLETQSLVESLLELARGGQAAAQQAREEVALEDIVRKSWDVQRAAAQARGMKLVTDLQSPQLILGAPALLERLVGNLLDNAVSHGDANSTIELRSRLSASVLELHCSNSASSATAEAASRAFEAFWRADAARAQVGRHAGLGLALCKRIVDGFGGEIEARVAGGKFAVTCRWPQ